MSNKIYYYLFGSDAVNAYLQDEDFDVTEAGLFKYIEGETIPNQLLDAFDGWFEWCEITEAEYLIFKQEQDEKVN